MSKKLKENQLLAAQLLAAGKSGREVAKTVGVTEETISRWKQDTDFESYVKKLLIEAHEAARTRLQSLAGKAVDVIEESLDDKTLSSKERFAIAVKIIEMTKEYDFDLDCRLSTPQGHVDSTGTQLLTPYAEELTKKAVKLARAGNVPALRMCLDRTVPKVTNEPCSEEPENDADLQQVAELMERYRRDY